MYRLNFDAQWIGMRNELAKNCLDEQQKLMISYVLEMRTSYW